MATLINYTGFSQVILPDGPFEASLPKANQLNYLINLYLHKKIKPFDISFIKEKIVVSKLTPFFNLINKQPSNLNLEVSLVRRDHIQRVNRFLCFMGQLRVPKIDQTRFLNKFNVFFFNNNQNDAQSSLIQLHLQSIKTLMASSDSVRKTIDGLFLKLLKD